MATKKIKKALTGTASPAVVLDPLQELYAHLDHAVHGNKFLAWYGQGRAQGMSHAAAIRDTVQHFRLVETPWYQARNLTLPED